jgi:hypothetical protein
MTASLEDARKAKLAAGAAARMAGHVVGLGLTKVGASYAVKVNLADAPAFGISLPDAIDGVPVVYEITGQPRKAAPV